MKRLPIPVLAWLLLGVGRGTAGELALDWPAVPGRQRLLGYLGASLAPLVRRAAPASLEARLAAPPFRRREDGLAWDLEALDPATGRLLREAAAASPPVERLDFEEAVAGANRAYLGTRPLAGDLAALRAELGIPGAAWATVEVESAIAGGRRRIRFVPRTALAARLEARATGRPLAYPVGTAFLAEELAADGTVDETHVLVKRLDQAWDFALYDRAGKRRIESPHRPRRFEAPTTCFACHSGTARVPPFREFPDPGPEIGGRRLAVHFPLTPAEAGLVRRLRPPGGIEDQVFGDYPGLAAVRLTRAAAAGAGLDPGEAAALEALRALVGEPGP